MSAGVAQSLHVSQGSSVRFNSLPSVECFIPVIGSIFTSDFRLTCMGCALNILIDIHNPRFLFIKGICPQKTLLLLLGQTLVTFCMDSLYIQARISILARAYADNFKMVGDLLEHTEHKIGLQSDIDAVYVWSV